LFMIVISWSISI